MKRRIRTGYFDKTCRTPLYYPGQSHITLIAPSRSGKGRDLLIPALLEFEGSCVVIDPKGELASITGPYRAKMGQVFVLNPFKILQSSLGKLTHAGFNPLAALNPQADSFGADCDSLAEAIVYEEGGDAKFFTDSARQLISGVIMTLAKYQPPQYRHVVRMVEIVTGSAFFDFAKKAANTGDFMIRARLERFAAHKASEDKTIMSIVETARTAVGFATNTAIAKSLIAGGPVLRFADLRQKPTTVYLVLPTKYLATSSKWFRLVIAAAMADLLQEGRGSVPVLALLDEFAQLGTLQVMTNIMGIGSGYGLQLWTVLQNLTQLSRLYPDDWQTFLANSGAQIFFAPRDTQTAQYVSEMCGVTEVHTESKSVGEMAWGPKKTVDHISVNRSYGQTQRPYLHPHEVRQIGQNEMLVFGENLAGVIRAGRKPYWEMPECRGKASPDPYHPKKSPWPF